MRKHTKEFACNRRAVASREMYLQNITYDHRFNMEYDLQSLFGLLCTAVPVGWDPVTPPPPAFGFIYEGAIGQPR